MRNRQQTFAIYKILHRWNLECNRNAININRTHVCAPLELILWIRCLVDIGVTQHIYYIIHGILYVLVCMLFAYDWGVCEISSYSVSKV